YIALMTFAARLPSHTNGSKGGGVRTLTYTLSEDGNTPIPQPDMKKWLEWFVKNRHGFVDDEKNFGDVVSRQKINDRWVLTSFLGMDRALKGSPIVWQTTIYSSNVCDAIHGYIEQCGGVRSNAVSMHDRVCSLARNECTTGGTSENSLYR